MVCGKDGVAVGRWQFFGERSFGGLTEVRFYGDHEGAA